MSKESEINEMKKAVLEILDATTDKPSKVFIGYDHYDRYKGTGYGSDTVPKIKIEWKGDTKTTTIINEL